MIDRDEYLTCCYCGDHKPLSDFNTIQSDIYVATGVLPICKKCLKKLFTFYEEQFMSSKLAVQRICAAFDLYYSDTIFNAANKDNATTITKYMSILNTAQYRGKSFNNSLIEGFVFTPEDQALIKDVSVSTADLRMWGKGFSAEDYEILNSHYELLKKSNENLASNQIIYVSDLCKTHLLKCKALEAQDYKAYNECSSQYMKLFKEAGLSLKSVDSLSEDDTWGTMIERIQKYTPSEYYKNKGLYADFDQIQSYVERFVYRPLKNLVTGDAERDPEFNIEEENGS